MSVVPRESDGAARRVVAWAGGPVPLADPPPPRRDWDTPVMTAETHDGWLFTGNLTHN